MFLSSLKTLYISPFLQKRTFHLFRAKLRFYFEIAKEKGEQEEFELFSNVEKFTKEIGKELKGENFEICANVDLYSGFVYKLLNIPQNIFTPLFALARIASWNAHRIEQITSDKKIIRPAYKAIDANGKLLV